MQWLRSAIDIALAAGITRNEIHTLVATAPPPARPLVDADIPWPVDPDHVVYDEVPRGLLTLADAAAKYGVTRNRLGVAVHRGLIPRAGRIRGTGRRGLRHLISENALRRYLKLDPALPESAEDQSDAVEAQPQIEVAELPYYDELPEGLITLTEGARRYGIRSRRIHRWLSQGRISRMGYLRGRGPQGGYVVLSESELAALVEQEQPNR